MIAHGDAGTGQRGRGKGMEKPFLDFVRELTDRSACLFEAGRAARHVCEGPAAEPADPRKITGGRSAFAICIAMQGQ